MTRSGEIVRSRLTWRRVLAAASLFAALLTVAGIYLGTTTHGLILVFRHGPPGWSSAAYDKLSRRFPAGRRFGFKQRGPLVRGSLPARRAAEQLIPILAHADAEIRRHAVCLLGRLGEARAVEPLIPLLREEGRVANEAAYALAEIGDARAVAPLMALLEKGDGDLAGVAAFALAEFAEPRVVETLVAQLGSDNDFLVRSAVWALGEIGDPAAVPALCTLAARPNGDEEACRKAVTALGKIGDPRAVPWLEKALQQSEGRLVAVIYALEGIGAPPPRSLVARLGQASTFGLLPTAGTVFERIGKSAVEALTAATADTDRTVRRGGATILLYVHDDEARKALLDLFGSELPLLVDLHRAVLERGIPETVPLLEKALSEHGDRNMAEHFLNCGVGELELAGRGWLLANGYSVRFGAPTSGVVRWGESGR